MKWFEKLRFARRVKGMSQATAARHSSISTGYLCAIEQGKIADPSFFKVSRLLRLYNLKPDDMSD